MIAEAGSDHAAELWNAPVGGASSLLCHPEGRAALAAAYRRTRLTRAQHRRARSELEAVYEQLLIVAIDEPLAREAGALAEQLGLRGYDAVHLASALALGPDTTLVSWDDSLRDAALQCGFAIAPGELAG